MIQINLIPDVKREFIRAQKMRSIVIAGAIFACGVAIALLALLGVIYGGERLRESAARREIDKRYDELVAIENIDEVLTIQNQMSKISSINENKTINSRLFDVLTAINPAVPNDVGISMVIVDPETRLLTIEGSAQNAFAATETFRKTILNTTLETTGDDLKVPLTDSVSIGETSYGETSDGGRVLRFSISFVYPEGLFDNTMKLARIASPTRAIDVTDSKTRVPDSLFAEQAADIKEDE